MTSKELFQKLAGSSSKARLVRKLTAVTKNPASKVETVKALVAKQKYKGREFTKRTLSKVYVPTWAKK